MTSRLGSTAALAFAMLASVASAQQEAIDMHLEDVGFVMRAATDEQFERLKSSLRPRTFVARVVNGRRYYVYSDPNLCKCVFLGDEVAMQSYRNLLYAAGSNAPNAAPATPSAPVLTEEMDESLSGSIAPGDILDY